MKITPMSMADENSPNGYKRTGEYSFKCPGCGDIHIITTETPQSNGAKWGFNGNLDLPTFTPSIFVKSGHYADGKTDNCWCSYNKEHPDNPAPFECYICHSFITDGKIKFLTDCTHELAGHTVELNDI